MGRPFRRCGRPTATERRHLRPSVVRRRARTGQSPDPRAADQCPVGPRAAPHFGGYSSAEQPGGCPLSGGVAVQFAGRSVALDTSAGIWLAESAVNAKPDTVAALVPSSFAAVARVSHPSARYV